jgi:hypothetical protein
MYLRINDTTTSASRVKGYETMTDINSGTGDFPTELQKSGGLYFVKNDVATAKGWQIVADEKFAYFFFSTTNSKSFQCFGDLVSHKNGDAFGTVIVFSDNGSVSDISSAAITNYQANSTLVGHFIARQHTQAGSSIQSAKFCPIAGGYMGNGGSYMPNYPNPIDNALHLIPVKAIETAGLRGTYAGLYSPAHLSPPFQDLDVVIGSGDFVGKKFLAIRLGYGSMTQQCLVEISDTWRA